MMLKLQEQGYNTVTKLAVRAFNYVSDFVMQTAIRVQKYFNALHAQKNVCFINT